MIAGGSLLADSNVLIHLTNSQITEHSAVRRAVARLRSQKVTLRYTLQNLAEFWNVCTRPGPSGLGLSIEETAVRLRLIEDQFQLLHETPLAAYVLKDLLLRYRVSGVQVHDARLVAAMITHGVQEILTFDQRDFKRYTEIAVLHPSDVK